MYYRNKNDQQYLNSHHNPKLQISSMWLATQCMTQDFDATHVNNYWKCTHFYSSWHCFLFPWPLQNEVHRVGKDVTHKSQSFYSPYCAFYPEADHVPTMTKYWIVTKHRTSHFLFVRGWHISDYFKWILCALKVLWIWFKYLSQIS
jgi:hypothetical protein